MFKETHIEQLQYWLMVHEHAADTDTKLKARYGAKEVLYKIMKEIHNSGRTND